MSTSRSDTPVLFLNGAWHGSWCWSEVLAHVTGAGVRALAVDMAGHGLRARHRPQAVYRRPFDSALLATEPSPVADIGLSEAADLLISQIKQLGAGSPVTVVAHSFGGVVLTQAAELAPELFAHAVYLAAVMPSSGVPPIAILEAPEMAGAVLTDSNLVVADPLTVGAMRIDVTSPDPEYRRALREVFYGDVAPEVADAALALLGSDAPVSLGTVPITLTADGWGSVPRSFIVTTQDKAVPPAMQRRQIAEADAAFPDNPTTVHTLESSHSPFLSMPDQLADIVIKLTRLPAYSSPAAVLP
jgi:pimeloyl-ACP methyl ester carboxylesterase